MNLNVVYSKLHEYVVGTRKTNITFKKIGTQGLLSQVEIEWRTLTT